jgi:cytochrome c oxidase subunit III
MTHTEVQTIDRWGGGTCPFDAGWRKVMMWWFIVTDGLLFAGFLAAYGYARILAFRWPDQSTVFSLGAVRAAREGRQSAALRFVLLTAFGGVFFLGMQAYEWGHLIGEGARLNTNPWGDAAFAAYFFLLTGFHGTHVLTGVIVLATTAIRSARGLSTADGVEIAGLYWHFVDLVWVFIFTLFYLL